MTSSKAIYDILSTSTPVVNALGEFVGAPCIFPNFIPATCRAFPAIVYQGQSVVEGVTAEGPIGPHQQEIQIASLARTYDEATDLGDAVETQLKNTKAGTYAGVDVMGIFYTGDVESEEGEVDLGDGVIVHQKMQTFRVWFK